MFNNDKKFDIDLAFGQQFEREVLEMVANKKIEVKTERDMWAETGNIAIEYMSYGKPSGIASTEAEYWFHNLAIGDEIIATLVFPVERLRKIIEHLKPYSINGGDNKMSKMYLVRLSTLLRAKTLLPELKKEEKQNNE